MVIEEASRNFAENNSYNGIPYNSVKKIVHDAILNLCENPNVFQTCFEHEKSKFNKEVYRAITNKELYLVYQPQVDVSNDNKICGLEALIRWNHPEKGFLLPKDFISYAENSRLISKIGKYALIEACLQVKVWQDKGFPIPVSVNISPIQFFDENLAKEIKDVITEIGISPELIKLELTESSAMTNHDYAARIMEKLNDLGVLTSIDDFGIGHSSLLHLKKFPIETIKIDKEFVDDIVSNVEDQYMIEVIIGIAKRFNYKIIAEGVENVSQLEILREFGCNVIQGFFFSRPVDVLKIEEYLRNDYRITPDVYEKVI